jgi:isopenicillin N synthase-like dioxygenase
MLDRLTGGWFRSTPHRVRNSSGRDRLSFPLFFDPDFAAEIRSLPSEAKVGRGESGERWDGADLHRISGRYGDYLLSKVGKVFPELKARVL